MNDSILTSVKKAVGGIIESDTAFDPELVMHINSSLAKLTQLGVGPVSGFQIEDATATWTDFMGDDPRLNMVKTYVALDIRMIFDPPTIGAVAEAFKSQLAELTYRINVQAESKLDMEEIQNDL